MSETGTYWISIPSRYCRLADTIKVAILDCSVTVPNVFTPNDDGKNDTFAIQFNPTIKVVWDLMIFNRWGKLIYQANPYQNDWTAKDLPSGLYYYYLSEAIHRRTFKGWVEVLR